MAVDAMALVGGALGGAVAQSVLGPLLGQRHERRDLRARVLRQIAEVENNRWSSAARDDFVRAAHELRSTALVAGLQRDPVEFYILVAAAARQKSDETAGEGDGEGGIPLKLGDLVREAAATVTDYAWHPHSRRPFLRTKMKRLQEEKADIATDWEDSEAVDWTQGLVRAVGASIFFKDKI